MSNNPDFIITEAERKKLEEEIKARDENERQIFNAGMKFGRKLAIDGMRKGIIKLFKELKEDD